VEGVFVAIALAAFGVAFVLQTAQPSAELLPAPTGPHKTGRMSFHWKDTSRAELETSAPDDTRELMVHVFYPTDANARGTRATYMPDADVMRGPINEALMQQVVALRAYSLDGAPVQRGMTKFPVLVLAPGGGMKGLTYHALIEDLASHGWVVAAIDPPYNARGVRFPDGRVLGNLPPAERGWPAPRSGAEEQRYYRERVAHWGRDVRFVIDQLTALDAGTGPFAKRLDLERGVGVVGHSRGGQAAGVARVFDRRVRGGINLDGTAGDFPIQPIDGDTTAGAQPFLWIQKTLETPTDAQLQRMGRTRAELEREMNRILSLWHSRLAQVSGGAMRVYIDRPGIAHIDFSDEPLWDVSMSSETRAAKLQTIADTRMWVRSFFDGTVRGNWAALKQLAATKRGDVTVHAFGAMWP
jgi:hypothetical protein